MSLNSAVPLSADDSLQPFSPLEKLEVSINPVDRKYKLFEFIVEESIVHPPIVPLVDFNKPAFVTLNGALANVECPNCIPSSPSAIKILLPLPSVILFPLGLSSKSVAVSVFAVSYTHLTLPTTPYV